MNPALGTLALPNPDYIRQLIACGEIHIIHQKVYNYDRKAYERMRDKNRAMGLSARGQKMKRRR